MHAWVIYDKVYHDVTFISKFTCSATTFYGLNKSLIYQFENRHVSMLNTKNKQPKKQIKLLKGLALKMQMQIESLRYLADGLTEN